MAGMFLLLIRYVRVSTDLVTDDVRRSGRASKGVNTKERDIAEVPAPKKGKGKGAKAKAAEEEEEEEDEYIRCVCGLYEEEEDVPRAMICCDKCSAWQHNDCMALPEDYAPEKYFCEQCRPQDHKQLLAAMKRGEKPWEEVARLRQIAMAEKAAKKRGGKKAKKAVDGEEQPATPATTQKRKAEESPAASDTKVSQASNAAFRITNTREVYQASKRHRHTCRRREWQACESKEGQPDTLQSHWRPCGSGSEGTLECQARPGDEPGQDVHRTSENRCKSWDSVSAE